MSMNHGTLVLKYGVINTLIELLSIPVAGAVARSRNRFILLFKDVAHEVESRRMDLVKKHANLDDKNEPIIKGDGQYDLKDFPAFEADFKLLIAEEFKLPCIGEQLVDFQNIHKLLINLDTPLNVEQTRVYDQVLTAFEAWEKGATV